MFFRNCLIALIAIGWAVTFVCAVWWTDAQSEVAAFNEYIDSP